MTNAGRGHILGAGIRLHGRSYARAAAPTYPVYGGNLALRGPIVDVLEGTLDVQHGTRLVVVQFPSLEQARAWWESEHYRPLVKLRQPPVADSRAVLVNGIDLANQR